MDKIEALVDAMEREVRSESEKEISSVQIGEKLMQRLNALDTIAYVGFAWVYRSFKDVDQFMKELREALESPKGKPPPSAVS